MKVVQFRSAALQCNPMGLFITIPSQSKFIIAEPTYCRPNILQGKRYTYCYNEKLVNFINLFSNNTLESVCFPYVKTGFTPIFPRT